ncbi:hypothetical protein [Hymenobacter sp. BT491]|uniref:hypothetical protein n=1 Tax=Hymenobacter sp. BT491 TaxID=2766779 RepID=UPI0016536E89|nr:hypothetical protein [Hymenobacter sp. BT491]MBC6988910.1 hypothetical protein [Hymenobacter sp. BT491]
MSVYTLRPGQHEGGTLVCPWFFKLPSLRKWVRFGSDCIYELPAYNQLDANKLYGASFGFSEDNSARFGWRYNPAVYALELLAFVHDKGQLNFNEVKDFPVVARLQPGDVAECNIEVTASAYVFTVKVNEVLQPYVRVPHGKLNLSYGVTRGLYFGGNLTPPQVMTVEISPKPL